jgi:hypothetical protein
MEITQINELDKILHQAEEALTDSQITLTSLIKTQDVNNESEASQLVLLLSYRLDTQEALLKILQIEHGLLAVLGLSPQHSIKINLERMNFALGHDDLQKMLRSFSLLLHSLLQMAQKNQKSSHKLSKQRQSLPSAGLTKFDLRLKKAIDTQKQFIRHLESFGAHLDLWFQKEALGPVLDHIAALRGPISRFYQALQNGLVLAHQLYEKMNQNLNLDNTLEMLSEQNNLVLKPLPPTHQPHPFFSPINLNEERLEQRASAKRLGNFFNH